MGLYAPEIRLSLDRCFGENVISGGQITEAISKHHGEGVKGGKQGHRKVKLRDGCRLHKSCFTCPEPDCIVD